LAVRADVVSDDEASVGPGDQDRAVKPGLLDDRRDVVRPASLVEIVLGRQRPLGHPVAAVVERHDAERLGERALDLTLPAQLALRPTVDEKQGWSVRVAPLPYVEVQSTTASNLVLRGGVSCHA